MSDSSHEMPRRRLLQLVAGIGVAAACSPPQLPEQVVAARAGEIPLGSSKTFRFGPVLALLIHAAPNRYYAVAADCTHGRCTVEYRSDSRDLFCPCHDGRFDLQGRILGGPASVPLQSFPVSVEENRIIVSRPAQG
ncbi:MAG TPA: Rieske (2Fe-2S) protein [Acidobacteriota bacterium]|nr:Rieske (2Fe-2S) protein [Acidobacteriota bacterium]